MITYLLSLGLDGSCLLIEAFSGISGALLLLLALTVLLFILLLLILLFTLLILLLLLFNDGRPVINLPLLFLRRPGATYFPTDLPSSILKEKKLF